MLSVEPDAGLFVGSQPDAQRGPGMPPEPGDAGLDLDLPRAPPLSPVRERPVESDELIERPVRRQHERTLHVGDHPLEVRLQLWQFVAGRGEETGEVLAELGEPVHEGRRVFASGERDDLLVLPLDHLNRSRCHMPKPIASMVL